MTPDTFRALIAQPEWMADANCRGLDPNLFFSERGESTAPAKAVCRACDVQAECLAYAVNNGETKGTWGGLSEMERRRVRRTSGLTVARKSVAKCGTLSGLDRHKRAGEPPCRACREASAAYQRERYASRRAGGAA